MDYILISSIISGILSLLFNIIGVSIPKWKISPIYYIGLFSACIYDRSNIFQVCAEHDINDGGIIACRAMSIMSIIVSVFAIILSILHYFYLKKKIYAHVSTYLHITGFIFSLLSLIIFGATQYGYNVKLGAGYWLVLISSILSILTIILMIVSASGRYAIIRSNNTNDNNTEQKI